MLYGRSSYCNPGGEREARPPKSILFPSLSVVKTPRLFRMPLVGVLLRLPIGLFIGDFIENPYGRSYPPERAERE